MSAWTVAGGVDATGGAVGGVVRAPVDRRGASLTAFVTQVRAAARSGDVVVDESACARWSPGQRLVLERLHAVVLRRGRRWTPA